VTGDGRHDARGCHAAILACGGIARIPLRTDGHLWQKDCPAARARNEILRATRSLGCSIWKGWSGDHIRSRIAAKMRCLDSCGERIASRHSDRQIAEVHIPIAGVNRFNVPGQSEIERVI